MTASAPPPAHGMGDDDALIPLAPVTELLKLFAKAVRAHQLYLPNNPMHARALDSVRAAFPNVWAHTDALDLVVTDTAFLCEGRAALEEPGRGSESLPWVFYKDGVRALEMRPGFEGRDLDLLLDVVQRSRMHSASDDDLLTLFWEQDFSHFNYRYVELGADGVVAPGAELLKGGVYGGDVVTIDPPSAVEGKADLDQTIGAGGAPPASSPFAKIDDFDTTLYFLEDHEIAYLHQAIREDFAADLRPSVVSALLDTFELEEDPTVREEISGILENFLIVLLSNKQFRTAAYLLRESAVAAERSINLLASQKQRLSDLANRLSDPAVLVQLLQALDEIVLRPPQDDLNELFGQLRGNALEPVLSHLARTQNIELRGLLERAASQLVASNTAELVRLIGSDDHAVANLAIRRAGALRSPAAVAPLAKLLASTETGIRKLAASALAEIGSAGAMQVLERAVDDDDRDVRMFAVRAVTDRQHRPALARVERVLKERVLGDTQNTSEKTAFFDAYAALAGEGAITFLDGILNPRGFLTRKEDTQTRACAAIALGKIGSERAFDALRKATNDKDVIVRTAAARALRGTT